MVNPRIEYRDNLDCEDCAAMLCTVCGHEMCPCCIEADCDHPDCITWNSDGSGKKTHACQFPFCLKHQRKLTIDVEPEG